MEGELGGADVDGVFGVGVVWGEVLEGWGDWACRVAAGEGGGSADCSSFGRGLGGGRVKDVHVVGLGDGGPDGGLVGGLVGAKVPALGLGVGVSEEGGGVFDLVRGPELGGGGVPEGDQRGRAVLDCLRGGGEGGEGGWTGGHEGGGVEVLPDGPEAVDVDVVHPEERVVGRGVEGRHVAASSAAGDVVDAVVHVFEAAVLAWGGVGVPLAVGEGVEVLVGEEEEADVVGQGGELVGDDGGYGGLVGGAGVADGGGELGPVGGEVAGGGVERVEGEAVEGVVDGFGGAVGGDDGDAGGAEG